MGLLKSAALRFLPEPVIYRLKKFYQPRRLERLAKAEEDLSVIRHLVSEGDHVVDVGANIGVYTLALSRMVGSKGRVYSFEPIPPTFELLNAGVRRFRLDNVNTYRYALSDTAGTATMKVPIFQGGIGNYYRSTLVDDFHDQNCVDFSVEVVKLDAVISGPISFLKIDVEGNELKTVLGGMNLIENCKPAISIEISSDLDNIGTDGAALQTRLSTMGYRVYVRSDGSLRRKARGDLAVNYFFLTDEQARDLTAS